MQENNPVYESISAAATRGALHHSMLISGSGDRLAAALYAAAGHQCLAEGKRPCLACSACRKVMQGIHPDVTAAEDKEHKLISIDVVRKLRSDAYVIPNEGRRKVYIFDDCARLDARSQDVLLKVVEEGPPYAAFIFLAESASELLPTLRSRSVELKLQGEAAAEENEAAEEFCRSLGLSRGEAAHQLLVMSAGKLKRDELQAFLLSARSRLTEALLLHYREDPAAGEAVRAAAKLPKEKLSILIDLLQKHAEDCDYNGGAGLILGALAAELEDIL